jgi:hypothetical protein
MIARLAGALALTGGVAWLVKVALIWENGGTNTTEGLVGLLFTVGAVAIVLAAAIWAWQSRRSATVPGRFCAVLLAVVAFVAAVNLPILVGWQVFGRTWVAEEVGVVVTALLAVALGQRWLRSGSGRSPQRS